jgi:peptidoglycan/LPS O-acetylase OafA/YrhL
MNSGMTGEPGVAGQALRSGQRFEVLDGMRGVAAIIVMIFHFFAHSTTYPYLSKNGYIAVDFFFILSGFVIMHSYGRRLATGMSTTDYVLRRVIRLYPMAMIGMLLGAVSLYLYCRLGNGDYSLREIGASTLSNLLLVPFLGDRSIAWLDGVSVTGHLFPGNNPMWSIFFEMVASLAFIGLCRLPAGTLRRTSITSFLLLIVFGLFYSFMDYHTDSPSYGGGWSTSSALGGFPRVFYGFTCGMLLYKVGEIPLVGGHVTRLLAPTGKIAALPPTLRCLLAYALLALCLMLPIGLNGFYFLFVIALAGPLLILFASRIELRDGAMLSVSRILGWLSYPLYCLHMPVLLLTRYADRTYGIGRWLPTAVIFFGAVFLLAWLLGKLIDEPVRGWLTGQSSRLLAGKGTLASVPPVAPAEPPAGEIGATPRP